MIIINRPVTIKLILTEKTKNRLTQEFQNSLQMLKIELEQLHFQKKKLLSEAYKQGNDAHKMVEQRIQNEERLRKEKIEQLEVQLKQLDNLELESEIIKGTVDSPVTIKEGDNWDEIMQNTEIIIRDGIVQEIRTFTETEESK